MPADDAVPVPIVIMRGGTSKGVFVRGADLPPEGNERDAWLLALMGSPDPLQLNGLGGAHSSTSKVMAVSRSGRTGCDVDYLFAQVGIDQPIVDYSANCGNLTAAVAAYAVDEGLVKAVEPVTQLMLFNRNTRCTIRARVPVHGGRAAVTGNVVIAGVPGSGAAIVTEYLNPAGVITGSLLPTGNTTDEVDSQWGKVPVSVVDVAGPVCFVAARDLEVDAQISPAVANEDAALLDRIETLRRRVGELMGRCTPAIPRLMLLAPAMHHSAADGTRILESSHDLIGRAVSMGRMHHACPGTLLLCTAAAVFVAGTVAAELYTGNGSGKVRIAHPKGVGEATVTIGSPGSGPPTIESVSLVRTARRLADGQAYVRDV